MLASRSASRGCGRSAGRAARRPLRCAASSAEAEAAALNEKHGIKGSVHFEVHQPGGLVKCVLTHNNKSTAEVHLFGACVTSYTQPSGDEVLYIRPDSKLDGSKPISGGIPICFPIFGPGSMQQHGFARNQAWSVLSSSGDVNPDYPEPSVTLRLSETAYSLAMWPHHFQALLEVTLRRDKLRVELRVHNPGPDSFDFAAALHSYFEVVDAGLPAVRVTGLKGTSYLDKVPDPKNPVRKEETSEGVTFGHGLLDRVYTSAPTEALLEVGTGAAVAVENTAGWTDTVLWNPAETMPECWRSFVCVESALTQPFTLRPGYDWAGETNISVVDL